MTAHSPALFSDACGLRQPLRLAVDDAAGDRIADGELDQPFACIGSAPDCDVVLTHPSVPEHVAFLQVIDGTVFIVELVNRSVHRLTMESPLRLGPFVLRLLTPPTAAPQTPTGNPFAQDASCQMEPALRLTSTNGLETRPGKVTQRLTLLGTGPGTPSAYLTLTASGLFVVDLLSDTRVNGLPTRVARLSVGDQLHVGQERYTVQSDRAEPMPAARVTEALLGGRAEMASAAGESTDALVPLSPARPSALLPTRLNPDLAHLLRQVGDIQCGLLDQLRQELDELVAGFDSLRREQLVAFGVELTRLREVTAQLTQETATTGVTTLGSQPIDLRAESDAGDIYCAAGAERGEATAESAALHQAMFERLATLSSGRPGLWHRLRGLLGRGEPME